jgi:hypothetical protein
MRSDGLLSERDRSNGNLSTGTGTGDETFRLILVSALSKALRPRDEMLRQIVVEAETIGDSRTMFRLRIDAT